MSLLNVIYFDFSKVFDPVPKRRLLYRRDHLGICGWLLGRVASFLSNCSFHVRARRFLGEGKSLEESHKDLS